MRTFLALLTLGVLAAAPLAPAAQKKVYKVAFIGPLSGPLEVSGKESLEGVRLAVQEWMVEKGLGGGQRSIEVEEYDDADDSDAAVKAYDAAVKSKCHAVIAASTGHTVDALVERARKGKLPLVLAGSAGQEPVFDLADPVVFMGAPVVEQALAMLDLAATHSENSTLDIAGHSFRPGFVVESTRRGRELHEALLRNLGPLREAAGSVPVEPRGRVDAAALESLRTADCDRVVVLGEPDLVHATLVRLSKMNWDVPVLCMDGNVSHCAEALYDRRGRAVNLVASTPRWAPGDPLKILQAAWSDDHDGPVPPRTERGYLAGELLFRAASKTKAFRGKEVVAALRTVTHGARNAFKPIVDEAGCSSLDRWAWYRLTGKGPEPIKASYLPHADNGRAMGLRPSGEGEVGKKTRVVWLTFGDQNSKKPRSIERDLLRLGLNSGEDQGEIDQWVLDELMTRTMGKLNRIFLKNYDGTFIPGVSFDIAFTRKKPEHLKPGTYWTVVFAGDGKRSDRGGNAFPGQDRCEVYSTYLLLGNEALRNGRVSPPIRTGDERFFDGTYSWAKSENDNIRSGAMRAALDGFAGVLAMKAAHELGHMCGLSHDNSRDTRSVMITRGGEGVSEHHVYYPPAHAKVIAKKLGRFRK
ncbi:MAG: ABC transporter substrate-binding protein [Planctomycetota bacterium]|jgi:hypothetical protein